MSKHRGNQWRQPVAVSAAPPAPLEPLIVDTEAEEMPETEPEPVGAPPAPRQRLAEPRGPIPYCDAGCTLYVVARGRIMHEGFVFGEDVDRNIIALDAEQAERFRDDLEPY